MPINQPDWNTVRAAVAGNKKEQLYRRVEQTVYDEAGEAKTQFGFEPIPAEQAAKASFERIESDVERLIQEVTSLQTAERELRNALEEPGGAEIRRR